MSRGERKRPNVFGDDSEMAAVQAGPKKAKGYAHVSPPSPRALTDSSARYSNSVRHSEGTPQTVEANVLCVQQGTPSFLPTSLSAPLPPSLPPPPPISSAIDIAAIRASIQAKFAKLGTPLPSAPPPPPPPSSNRLPPVPGLPKPNLDPDLAKKIADARRLVESMQAKRNAQAKPANPYLVRSRASWRGGRRGGADASHHWSQANSAPSRNDPVMDPSIAARGGLSMAAHPLLMDTSVPVAQTKKERYKPMVPKFSTTKVRTPPSTLLGLLADGPSSVAGQRPSSSPSSETPRGRSLRPRARLAREHALLRCPALVRLRETLGEEPHGTRARS